MNGKFDLHDKREQNKIGLETYSLDKTNVFDIAIDKLIEELKKIYQNQTINMMDGIS